MLLKQRFTSKQNKTKSRKKKNNIITETFKEDLCLYDLVYKI